MEINWKNKYLKYKLKYIELKNVIGQKKNIQYNVLTGGYEYLTPNEEQIFSQIYNDNIENNKWDKKSILLDCIEATKMQTETIKFIKYIGKNKKITPTKSQLEICLIFSVFCGYYLVVEELINLGANPNINYGDWSLVDTAIDFYFYKTAKILMEHGGLSKKYYSQEQLNLMMNFSNDPENYISMSDNTKKLDNQIYLQFKEKLLNRKKFNFENLSRNILKTKLKIIIKKNKLDN
jgi:hypothetical protein